MSLVTLMPINCGTYLSKTLVADWHGCHTSLKFGVKANENQDNAPKPNWLDQFDLKTMSLLYLCIYHNKYLGNMP